MYPLSSDSGSRIGSPSLSSGSRDSRFSSPYSSSHSSPPRSLSDSSSGPPTDRDDDHQVDNVPSQKDLFKFTSLVAQQGDRRIRRPIRSLTSRLLDSQTPRHSPFGRSAPASEADAPSVTNSLEARLNPRLDDRWPLEVEDLRITIDRRPLAETIRDLATATIRRENLHLKTWTPHEPSETLGQGDLDLEVDDHEEPPLPLDLVQTATAFVDEILAGLAALRPAEPRTKRRKLRAMNWQAVISAAALTSDSDFLHTAHQRIKTIYDNETSAQAAEDVLASRLKVLHQSQSLIQRPTIDSIYASALPPPPKKKRAHLSREEEERRKLKREARLERRKAKSELKAARQAAKSTKEEQVPRHRKRKPTKDNDHDLDE